MKKLLFVFENHKPEFWMDGLYAALQDLEKDFEITRWNIALEQQSHQDKKFDWILGWGGFNSRVDNALQNGLRTIGKKYALCIGGNAFPPRGADFYDTLFYETKWYRPQIDFHKHIVQAFGVNTNIFNKIDYAVPVVWDYLGVGSLSSWKRWEKMIEKKGNKLVVGEYQNGNEKESLQIARDLLLNGVMVSNMVSPYDLANLYHWSRTVYLPSSIVGGGERALLEARSCDTRVEVEDDNPKLLELMEIPVPSHIDYANKLREGLWI